MPGDRSEAALQVPLAAQAQAVLAVQEAQVDRLEPELEPESVQVLAPLEHWGPVWLQCAPLS